MPSSSSPMEPPITLDDVAAKLDGRLARYKIPKSVVVVDALPRNVLGKLDKKQLRSPVRRRPPCPRRCTTLRDRNTRP